MRTGYVGTTNKFKEAWDLGVEAGLRPIDMLGVGLEIAGYSTPRTSTAIGLSRLEMLAKATFHPVMGNIPVLKYTYIGLGAGVVYDHVVDKKKFSLGVAPLIGIDVPVDTVGQENSQFSVGAASSYLFVGNSMPDALKDLEARAGVLEAAGVKVYILRGDESVLKLALR